jgi:ankyrin repeat protein
VCGVEFDLQDGWTALMYAAQDGRAECVRLLINAGADKEAKDNVRRWKLLC